MVSLSIKNFAHLQSVNLDFGDLTILFLHTPHLAWLGRGPVRDDRMFNPQEAKQFLAHPVVIEAKLDCVNIDFSLAPYQPPVLLVFSGVLPQEPTW